MKTEEISTILDTILFDKKGNTNDVKLIVGVARLKQIIIDMMEDLDNYEDCYKIACINLGTNVNESKIVEHIKEIRRRQTKIIKGENK